jgi:hypothetical protein
MHHDLSARSMSIRNDDDVNRQSKASAASAKSPLPAGGRAVGEGTEVRFRGGELPPGRPYT